jgi:small subunit ribosomal protein S17
MESCGDKNCPVHGGLKVRGQVLEGRVIRDRMKNTVVVERDYLIYIPKYERYRRSRSRIMAHNPPCIGASRGDEVKIANCRKVAKNVDFVVIEKKKGEVKNARTGNKGM